MPAWADRGALSVDVAVGGAAVGVPAPLTASPVSTVSFDVSVLAGVRYALSNLVELSVSGFFEPPATLFHNDVTLRLDSGDYPGTLKHELMRYGAQAGARLVFGMRFRFHVGLELGWAQLAYSKLVHYDTRNPEAAVDYGLTLADDTRNHLVVSPVAGIEWAAGDKWSFAVLPRAQLMVGSAAVAWAIILPLQFSWSWYL